MASSRQVKHSPEPNQHKKLSTWTRFKHYLVRRWIRELPSSELKEAYEYKWSVEQMNIAYEKLNKDMIDTFFTEAANPTNIYKGIK